MLGCDVRNLSRSLLELVTNKKLIEVNQDPECRGAFKVSSHPWISGRSSYMRFLSNGEYAVGFFNLSDTDGDVPFYLYSAGLGESSGYGMVFENLITGETSEVRRDYYSVELPAHGCAMFRARLVKL